MNNPPPFPLYTPRAGNARAGERRNDMPPQRVGMKRLRAANRIYCADGAIWGDTPAGVYHTRRVYHNGSPQSAGSRYIIRGDAPRISFRYSASAISRIRRSDFSQPRQASVMLLPQTPPSRGWLPSSM